MKPRIIYYLIVIAMLSACGNTEQKTYSLEDYKLDYEGTLDTILPHFAKLHDSMSYARKFDPAYKHYMEVHKKEREYEWLNYHKTEQGYDYFLITRAEPSLNRDKYSAICGRFRRNESGNIDSASYEELFWTWKMKKPELIRKANKLFSVIIEKGNVDEYVPEKMGDEWVEFPGNGVVYDKSTQNWIRKSE